MDNFSEQTVQEYTLGKLISEDVSGAVYEAMHPNYDFPLAFKLFSANISTNTISDDNIQQARQQFTKLKHPNCRQPLHFGQHEAHYYAVSKLVPGINLRQLIQENKNGIPLWDTLHIFQQIATSLAHVHKQALFHHSLEPVNVLLTRSERSNQPYQVVLTDYSASIISQIAENAGNKAWRTVTPAYISPENVQKQPIDARSNIYSFGVMMYESLTGFLPFPIRSAFDAVRFHRSGRIVSVRAYLPQVPIRLDALIRQMLAPEPDRRPQTAGNLLAGIQRILRVQENQKNDAHSGIQLRVDELVAAQTHTHRQPDPDPTPSQLTVRLLHYDQFDDTTYIVGDKPLIIGRLTDVDIPLVSSERFVSRRHCEISREGEQLFVRDLNSSNGTMLDDQRLLPKKRVRWLPDQLLRLGPFTLIWGDKSDSDMFRLANKAGHKASTQAGIRMQLVCSGGYPQKVPLGKKPLIIGRTIECDMSLNHSQVSKKHCSIALTNAGIQVTDLGSTNGTILQGERLTPHQPILWKSSVPLIIGPFSLTLNAGN